ncbi:MAG: nicotinamide riboside transporter PnuC [Salibacteraceae bacterium]
MNIFAGEVMDGIETYTLIEILSVGFNLVYLILLIRENIWCWAFGIVASILSVYLFVHVKLYSEAVLYSAYIGFGIYGWLVWSGVLSSAKDLNVVRWKLIKHLPPFFIGALCFLGLGYFFKNETDAEQPFLDAFSTAFSFIASYLEAHKVLGAWVYWVGLNLFSVWLYYSRDLTIYAGLMVVYSVASVWGFVTWKKSFQTQNKLHIQ